MISVHISPVQTRGSFLILLLAIAGISASAQPKVDLTQAETERVFNGLGPAVQVLGQDYDLQNIDARMRYYRVPGVAVALVENDEIRWVRYFGVREADGNAPVDASTRFMVKSLSKPVTAFAALRLVDTTVFALDEPARNYLQQWRIPQNEFTEEREPTLRLILSHSAGFNLPIVPSYKEGAALPTLLQALNGEPPAAPSPVLIDYVPGTRSLYSGGGYSVLQLMIEEATGTPFPKAMRQLVLDSLRMDQSIFYPGIPKDIQKVTAVGHDTNGHPIEGRWERIVQMAAGGLVSTPEDMARFIVELNKAWQGASDLLSQNLAREMMTPNAAGWGLGLRVSGEGSRLMYQHGGATDGFMAILVGFPAIRKGAVILTNSDAGGELRFEILRSLADEYVWPAFRVIKRPTIPLEPVQLRSYEGRYELDDGSVLVVAQDTGRLSSQWGDLPGTVIFPSNDTLFFNTSNEEFIFSSWEDSLPSAITWTGAFGSRRGERRQ